ncbi:unnamed protein product [Sphagnum balticum]
MSGVSNIEIRCIVEEAVIEEASGVRTTSRSRVHTLQATPESVAVGVVEASGSQLASPSQSEVGSAAESVATIVVESMDTSPVESVQQTADEPSTVSIQSMNEAYDQSGTQPMAVAPIAVDIVVEQPLSVVDESALPSTVVFSPAVTAQDESAATATAHPDASQEETAPAAVVTAPPPQQPVSTCARFECMHTLRRSKRCRRANTWTRQLCRS